MSEEKGGQRVRVSAGKPESWALQGVSQLDWELRNSLQSSRS